jgi:hypothetical protein
VNGPHPLHLSACTGIRELAWVLGDGFAAMLCHRGGDLGAVARDMACMAQSEAALLKNIIEARRSATGPATAPPPLATRAPLAAAQTLETASLEELEEAYAAWCLRAEYWRTQATRQVKAGQTETCKKITNLAQRVIVTGEVTVAGMARKGRGVALNKSINAAALGRFDKMMADKAVTLNGFTNMRKTEEHLSSAMCYLHSLRLRVGHNLSSGCPTCASEGVDHTHRDGNAAAAILTGAFAPLCNYHFHRTRVHILVEGALDLIGRAETLLGQVAAIGRIHLADITADSATARRGQRGAANAGGSDTGMDTDADLRQRTGAMDVRTDDGADVAGQASAPHAAAAPAAPSGAAPYLGAFRARMITLVTCFHEVINAAKRNKDGNVACSTDRLRLAFASALEDARHALRPLLHLMQLRTLLMATQATCHEPAVLEAAERIAVRAASRSAEEPDRFAAAAEQGNGPAADETDYSRIPELEPLGVSRDIVLQTAEACRLCLEQVDASLSDSNNDGATAKFKPISRCVRRVLFALLKKAGPEGGGQHWAQQVLLQEMNDWEAGMSTSMSIPRGHRFAQAFVQATLPDSRQALAHTTAARVLDLGDVLRRLQPPPPPPPADEVAAVDSAVLPPLVYFGEAAAEPIPAPVAAPRGRAPLRHRKQRRRAAARGTAPTAWDAGTSAERRPTPKGKRKAVPEVAHPRVVEEALADESRPADLPLPPSGVAAPHATTAPPPVSAAPAATTALGGSGAVAGRRLNARAAKRHKDGTNEHPPRTAGSPRVARLPLVPAEARVARLPLVPAEATAQGSSAAPPAQPAAAAWHEVNDACVQHQAREALPP